MSTLDDSNARRYLDITRAHHTLTVVARAAGYVNHYANELVVLADEVPVRDALVNFRDMAGKAAIGQAPPLDASDWDRAYADALTKQLGHLADEADAVAAGARTVLAALDAGLITAPRTWRADEVADGTMRDYLERLDQHGGDASQLWTCVSALRGYLTSEAISEAVYDRHMDRITDIWHGPGYVEHTPKHEAALTRNTLAAWNKRQHEANNALAEPVPYLHAARLIHSADTFDRLTHYAAALTGPAWSETAETTDTYDNARQSADRLMIELGRRFNTKMHTDAAGVERCDADKLATIIAVWRSNLVDDAVTFANTLDIDDYENHVAAADAMEDAYKRLYRTADVAVTTSEMVDIWHACDALTDEHAGRVRTVLALRFDDDHALPGLGQRITVAGANREATRELRRLVDAHDMPSNANETMTYRGHAAALAELDMRNPDAPTASVALARVWEEIVSDADAGNVTRRQLAALRNLANVKIAEYCDGDEYRAESVASRLPEWERIGDELAAYPPTPGPPRDRQGAAAPL